VRWSTEGVAVIAFLAVVFGALVGGWARGRVLSSLEDAIPRTCDPQMCQMYREQRDLTRAIWERERQRLATMVCFEPPGR